MSLRFSGSIRFRLKPSVRCILFRVSDGVKKLPRRGGFGSFGVKRTPFTVDGVRCWRFGISSAEDCKGFPQRKLKISYKLKAGPNHLNRDRGSVKPVGNSGDVVKFRSRDFKPEVPKGHNKILRTISQFMNRLWTNFKIVYNLKVLKFNTKVLTTWGFWKNEFYKVTYFGHKSVNPLL